MKRKEQRYKQFHYHATDKINKFVAMFQDLPQEINNNIYNIMQHSILIMTNKNTYMSCNIQIRIFLQYA